MGTDHARGRCHICKVTPLDVDYCAACDHWFCSSCYSNWYARGIAALKAIIKFQARGDCCGPIKQ